MATNSSAPPVRRSPLRPVEIHRLKRRQGAGHLEDLRDVLVRQQQRHGRSPPRLIAPCGPATIIPSAGDGQERIC